MMNDKYSNQPSQLETNVPNRDPDVVATINALYKDVEALRSVLLALGTRLAPVTRPEVANNNKPERPMRLGSCPLSSQILEVSNAINTLHHAVTEQIELLEI